MKIRRATSNDVSAIAAISREFGYEPTEADVEQALLDILQRDDHVVFVAEDNGAVMAWGHARVNRQLEVARYAELVGLVVTRASRSQGVGAEIVKNVEAWARAKGERSLRVFSNTVRERAHGFYVRENYKELKQQKVFVKAL